MHINQCIIAERYGHRDFFLYLTKNGTLVCRVKNGNTFPALGELSLAEGVRGFDAVICSDNLIHIAYTSQSGTLNYIRYNGGKWLRCALSEKGFTEFPTLHLSKNRTVFLIYSYFRLGRRMLYRLPLSDAKSHPEQLAELSHCGKIYTAHDTSGGVYLFFYNTSGDFVCKILHSGSEHSDIDLTISHAPQSITDFQAVYHKGKIHIFLTIGDTHFISTLSSNGSMTEPTPVSLSEFGSCSRVDLLSDGTFLSFIGFDRNHMYSMPCPPYGNPQNSRPKKSPVPRDCRIFHYKLCRASVGEVVCGLCRLSKGQLRTFPSDKSLIPFQNASSFRCISKKKSIYRTTTDDLSHHTDKAAKPALLSKDSAQKTHLHENKSAEYYLANEISLLRTEIAELRRKIEKLTEISALNGDFQQ